MIADRDIIQLWTRERKVLYEQKASEMFPDYISVFKEAIALQIDLKGLYVDFKDFEGIDWLGTHFDDIEFIGCSLHKNTFTNCSGNLKLSACKISNSKFKSCDFEYMEISGEIKQFNIIDCNFKEFKLTHCATENFGLTNNTIETCDIDNCDIRNTLFYKNQIDWFDSSGSHIPRVIFDECKFNYMRIVNIIQDTSWYEELAFVNCVYGERSTLSGVKDFSKIYLKGDKINDFENEDESINFTIIYNEYTTIICSLDQEIIWWWYKYDDAKLPKRLNFREFLKEAENEFLSYEIDPQIEVIILIELNAVAQFIKPFMRKKLG